MKKQLVASLAAAMVLGVAGSAFAASNPFVDVPAKHWAYDSVTKLAQAGIVDGYSDGKFQGDKVMSRYEMAQIVAKAMAKSDKADASQKAAIDKLAVEFASELEGLNVRVNKLEKNASSVKITGEARLRYENTTYSPDVNKDFNNSILKLRTRLGVAGNINDDWTYAGRFENTQNMRTASGDNTTEFNIAYVRGHIAGIDTTIGRQEYMPNYGLLLDTSMDGAKFSFGNVLKTNVYYGRNSFDGSFDAVTATSALGKNLTAGGNSLAGIKTDIIGADFKYGTSKVTNITAGIYQLKAVDAANNNTRTAYEIGVDTKLSNDWAAKAGYAKVTGDSLAGGKINDHNKAYMIGFDYKVADKTKVGSYSAFVNYRNIQENADLVPTFDNAVVAHGAGYSSGGKGYEVGFKYVPMANSVFTTKYVDLKSTENGSDAKNKFYQAQMEFFF